MSVRRVIVEADGGSRGNPGPAGYGALLRDADTGEVLREMAAGIGTATNNVAEYQGLLAGLRAAVEIGADDVEVRMDSKLVVEQMSGRWQVKHPDMKVLARQAADLVRTLPAVRFTHVRRGFNAHADRLANAAMDAVAAGRSWTPSSVDEPIAPGGAVGAVDDPESGTPGTRPAVLYGWGPSHGPTTQALLLRHGETAHTVDKRFSGRGDIELSERGVRQADAAARRLAEAQPVAVISSPIRRTVQTAERVAAAVGLTVATDDGLAETDFGDWESLTFAEVSEQWPQQLGQWLSDPTVAPPGGESLAATAVRVEAARARLLEGYPDAAIVVVTHVTPIKLLVRQALDAPIRSVFATQLDAASVSVIDWHADAADVLRGFNATDHLGAFATRRRLG